jgi:tRNA threonylcarbamoyladenosine biosynthesis protein TsaE
MRYLSHSATETQVIAKDLATQLSKGGVVALIGNLGAGKTTFVQGFCNGLGIPDKVISPTFVIVRQHQIPQTPNTLFHIDLYRLTTPESVETLGISDFLADPHNIVLIEWPEKILDKLPQNTVIVHINKVSENEREISIESKLDN